MTVNTVEERTRMEMSRGQFVASKAVRLDRIARLRRTPGVVVGYFHIPYGNGEVWGVGGIEIARVDADHSDYPTEQLLAVVSLAIAATGGLDRVPDADARGWGPDAESKEYNRRLAERNAPRWENNDAR